MKHAIDFISGENFVEIGGAADVAFECCGVLHERSMSGGKVIKNDRVKAGGFQRLYRVTANIAGTAGDENHATATFLK